jgi:hypothetical protein
MERNVATGFDFHKTTPPRMMRSSRLTIIGSQKKEATEFKGRFTFPGDDARDSEKWPFPNRSELIMRL